MNIKQLTRFLAPDWVPNWVPGRKLSIFFQLLCLAALLPVIYVCRYIHPSGADDYPDATWNSFAETFLYYYNTNGGRYFSLAALLLNPLHWRSMIGYQLACLALLLLFLWCFYSLIHEAIERYTTAAPHISRLIAAMSVVLMLMNMKGLAQNFFWYTGAVVYTLSAVLMSQFLRMLMASQDCMPGAKQQACLYVLCIAIMGTNELMMLLCLVLCIASWIINRTQARHQKAKLYGWLCIVCIVCAIIYVTAPGNYHRLDEQQRSLGMSLPNWLYFTQKFAFTWIKNPFLIGFSIFVIIITQQYALRKPVVSLLGSFLLVLAVLYFFFLPVNVMLGNLYYARVRNLIYVFFILAWIGFLLHLSYAIRQLLLNHSSDRAVLKQLLLVCGLVILLFSINTNDLRLSNLFVTCKGLAKGIPQRYSAELDARYGLLRSSGDSVTVARLTTKDDNIVYFLDISADPKNYQNIGYARYWGKKSIAVAHDSIAIPASRQK